MQILGRIRRFEEPMTANDTCYFQHEQKQDKIITELSSWKTVNAEIEECGYFYLLSLFLVRRSKN
jgi:hypothetical protein